MKPPVPTPIRRHAPRIGIEVPWVTSWSAETVTGVAPCPSVDGLPAVGQAWKPGEGEPLYPRNHLFRQRKSVREMLCPMCGAPTHDGDRWSQTGHATTAGAVRAKGLGRWLPADMADDRPLFDAGAIAPLHKACAERSLKDCPHLAARPDKALKRFPSAWIVIPLMIESRPLGPLTNMPLASVEAVSVLQLVGVPS